MLFYIDPDTTGTSYDAEMADASNLCIDPDTEGCTCASTTTPEPQCDEDKVHAVDWHELVCLFGGDCLLTITRCVGTHPLFGTMMMWDRGSSIITVLIA